MMPTVESGFRLIQQGEVDTIAVGIHKTIRKQSNLSFSNELYSEQPRFIMLRRLNIYNSIWSFFRIFDSNIWLIIFLSLLVQCLFCVLIRKTELRMNSNNSVGILESFWQILRFQLLQPETACFKTKSGKVLITCFSLIQCTILLGIFSSWILSNILLAGHTVPINSLHQLIFNIIKGKYSLVTHSMSHWFFDNINESQTYPYAELRLATKRNPVKLTGSSKESMDEIINGRAVAFVEEDSGTYFNAFGHCEIVEFFPDLPFISKRLIFNKNSSFLNDVNRVIRENKMLILRIKRKYLEEFKERHRPDCIEHYKPIGIMPYLGLVIVCVSIFLFALLILFCEIGVARKFGVQNRIVDDEIEESDNVQKQIQFKNATTKMLLARRNTQDRRELKRCKRSRAKCIIVANIIRSK